MQVVNSSTGCHSRAILGIHFTEVLNFVFVRQGCWTIRGHTNPLLPSSFDMFFAKCIAISTTKKAIDYRNLKPTRFHWFHYRIFIPLNSTEYFYHVLCAPALFQSENLNTPTRDFHPCCCPLFPIWTLLRTVDSTWFDKFCTSHYCQWKESLIQGSSRFLSVLLVASLPLHNTKQTSKKNF